MTPEFDAYLRREHDDELRADAIQNRPRVICPLEREDQDRGFRSWDEDEDEE